MGGQRRTRSDSLFARLRRAVWHAARDYALTARSEKAGLETLKGLVHSGPLCWLGLAVLLMELVSAAYLASQGQRYPLISAQIGEGRRVLVPFPVLYLSIFFLAFGWAYLLTGAAGRGPALYVFVAIYAAFYGLIIGINLDDSPWHAIVAMWLLFLGSRVVFSQASRWRWLWLLPLVLVVSVEGSPSLPLPGPWNVLVWWAISLVVVAGVLPLRGRAPNPAIAFAVSYALLAMFYVLTIWLTPADELLIYAAVSLDNLLGFLGLFWYWLGLDVLNDARNLAGWLMRVFGTFLSPRILKVAAFSLWALWCVFACWLVCDLPPGVEVILKGSHVGEALLRASAVLKSRLYVDPHRPFVRAVTYSLYATLGLMLIAFILLGLRRLSAQRVMGLLMLSLAGFVAIWGTLGLESAMLSAREEVGDFWPMLILLGGMFWQVLKVSSDLVVGGRGRPLLFLGFLLILGGISLLELWADRVWFRLQLSANMLIGLVYLGIPYVLYLAFYKWRRYTPIAPAELLLLFALGMLSAIPALLVKEAFFVPLLWLGIVLGTVWRSGAWDDPWDGVVYLTTLALGFVVFYSKPIQLPLAYLMHFPKLLELSRRYLAAMILPWDARWWWLLLSAVGAATIQGYLFFRAHRLRGRERWLLVLWGTALAGALLALVSFLFVGVW